MASRIWAVNSGFSAIAMNSSYCSGLVLRAISDRSVTCGPSQIDTAATPQRLVLSKGANQFTEEHLRLMIAIGHQAALAVEDTSYYKALVQAERLAAVGQAVASLSHHIKNILQGVRGGSYLIELGLNAHDNATSEGEADLDEAQSAVGTIRKGWSIVERNQERISALVLDMLTFSKEREPEPEPGQLNEVAADVVELMQTRADDLGVALQWQPDDAMPQLMFDPEGLHRAILNLVTNAIDACDETDQGAVTVATRYDEPHKTAYVTVQDNGPGIAPEDMEAIFTAFVSRKGGRGTGLGLPGGNKAVMDPDNALRILRGEQFVDLIPERFRKEMAAKHITRVVKGDDGSGSFEVIDQTDDVIKLAGRPGTFDLSEEYGVPAKLVEALDITTQLAMAAGIDALREAGIPLVQSYRTTSKGTFLPEKWLLPAGLRDETGVIFASAFPGGDRMADEFRRFYAWDNRRQQIAALEQILNTFHIGGHDAAQAALIGLAHGRLGIANLHQHERRDEKG